jgi:hypothetical protein
MPGNAGAHLALLTLAGSQGWDEIALCYELSDLAVDNDHRCNINSQSQ